MSNSRVLFCFILVCSIGALLCKAQDVKQETVYLKTADGSTLRTIYYYSTSFEAAPVSSILMRTPYNIDTSNVRQIATIVVAAYKFALVTQDFEGRFVPTRIALG